MLVVNDWEGDDNVSDEPHREPVLGQFHIPPHEFGGKRQTLIREDAPHVTRLDRLVGDAGTGVDQQDVGNSNGSPVAACSMSSTAQFATGMYDTEITICASPSSVTASGGLLSTAAAALPICLGRGGDTACGGWGDEYGDGIFPGGEESFCGGGLYCCAGGLLAGASSRS